MGNIEINLTLKIWRQKSEISVGNFDEFKVKTSPEASILEMLDELNNDLEREGKLPIAFESDCREGICGTCGLVINGRPHGPQVKTATCQIHMRIFNDGDTIYIEPFRAKAFKVIKDLVVDRIGFDKIQQAGGYVSFNTGSAPDANAIPIPKVTASLALDAAECIGCGACVGTCPVQALTLVDGKVTVDAGTCVDCGACVGSCPVQALSL